MKKDLEKYFVANTKATYKQKDGRTCLISASNEIRINTAKQQYEKSPAPITAVISFVNEFLNILSEDDSFKKPRLECIRIGGGYHSVIDRAVIINGCTWEAPIYDEAKKRYTFWDRKYNIIKKHFNLRYANDIIWMKFTEDGYLGVVADSFDINFRYYNSSGKLIRAVDSSKKWNEACVVVFPITDDLLSVKSRKEIETAIGNYLIEKGVPIIDYFSHNNF